MDGEDCNGMYGWTDVWEILLDIHFVGGAV